MNAINGQLKKKNDGISVAMKRQSFHATCLDALEEWKRRTVYNTSEVSVVNALLEVNAAAWIDKPLFTDAFAELLDFAARASANNDKLKLTIASSGISSFRVLIDYTPSPERNVENRLYNNGRFSSVTRQIISQHGGSLEFNESRYSGQIIMRIP